MKNTADIVIVGGAMMGSSLAWWLTELGHTGRIVVVERDSSYAACSSAHTNSCMRQQFGTELNVRISQFCAEVVRDFRGLMGGDLRVPKIDTQLFGYMYLAADAQMARYLMQAHAVQTRCGAATRLMDAEQIAREYPFYDLEGIVLGSHNPVDEGYFDGTTMFDWWRRIARERGVTYVNGEVTGIDTTGGSVRGVMLADGSRIDTAMVVNAAGPRAGHLAAMIGATLPVAPRKRYTWVFEAETPLSRDLPLTIDPSGVHVRSDGATRYMAGCTPDHDPDVDPADFDADHDLWLDKAWPAIATRIPAFERIKVIREWVGHYAYNDFDQNAILGPHDSIGGFWFMNGFSGHGFQQAAAMGRGLAERIVHGAYRSLDLSPFDYTRIATTRPFTEAAVI
jgi:glycine/D-amino acid oxidase-like deaminating enzyme